eukprot:7706371-Alexandrium_andersonii.AAC.1
MLLKLGRSDCSESFVERAEPERLAPLGAEDAVIVGQPPLRIAAGEEVYELRGGLALSHAVGQLRVAVTPCDRGLRLHHRLLDGQRLDGAAL